MAGKNGRLYNILSEMVESFVGIVNKELELMPIFRWNESVFRYLVASEIQKRYPDIRQFHECDRVDLVLKDDESTLLLEFKFYIHAQKYDIESAIEKGKKGWPGKKNISEFWRSVDVLREKKCKESEKAVILLFADPENKLGEKYSKHYLAENIAKDTRIESAKSCKGIHCQSTGSFGDILLCKLK